MKTLKHLVPILCLVAYAVSVCGGVAITGENTVSMTLEDAKRILHGRDIADKKRLIEAVRIVASSGDEAPILNLLGSDEVVKRCLSISVKGDNSQTLLMKLFETVAKANCKLAERVLVEALDRSPPFGELTSETNYPNNYARVKALGFLGHPDATTLKALEGMVIKKHSYSGAAITALASMRDIKARKILKKEIQKRFKANGDYGVLIWLQFHRDKPNSFELLCEGFQMTKKRQVLQALLTKRDAIGLPPSAKVPSYDSVESGDAKRYIASLNSILDNKKELDLSEEQQKGLEAIIARMEKKAEVYRKEQATKVDIEEKNTGDTGNSLPVPEGQEE